MSQCATTEEFVAVFHPYLERDGLFIATGTPEELGGSIRFVMTLASGEPILRGEAQVVESHHDKGNFYGLRGMKVRFASLDPTSERTLKALQSGPNSRVSKATASRSLVECIIYDEPGSDAAEPLSSPNQASDSPDSSPGVATPGDVDEDVTAVAQSPNKPPASPARSARSTAIPPIPRAGKPPEPPTLRNVEMIERDRAGFAVPRPMSESDDEDAGDLPVASDDEATATAPAQLRSAAVAATRKSAPRARPPISDTEVTMKGTPPPELMTRAPLAADFASPHQAAGSVSPDMRALGKPPPAVPDDATIKMPALEHEPSAAPPPAPPPAVVHPSAELQPSDLAAGHIASGEISSGEVSGEISAPSRLPSVPPGSAPPAEPRSRTSSQQPPLDRRGNSGSYEARHASQPPGAERPRRRPVVEIATPTEIVSPLALQAPAATGQRPVAPPRPETVRAGQVRTAAVSATFGALLGLAAGYFLWGFDQDNQTVHPAISQPADASAAITMDARPAPAVIADAAPASGAADAGSQAEAPPPDAAPAAAAAVLELTSAPSGAQVTVDGVVIGKTPIEHPVTGDGPFEIVVNQRGFRPWSRKLDISYLAEPIHAQLRRSRKRRR